MELRDLRRLRALGIGRASRYDIAGARPGVHLGVPGPTVTVVVDLLGGLDLRGPGLAGPTGFRICVGGLHTEAYEIHHDGAQRGLYFELTPRAVRQLFGLPVAALTGAVELAELSGVADAMYERAAAPPAGEAAPSALAPLVALARPGEPGRTPHPDAERAWETIAASRGTVTVRELTERSGWSARYLTTHFTAEYGLGLKQAARLHRFHHARLALESGTPAAAVAADLGYADQAHLSREFTAFLGTSPARYLAHRVSEFTPV